MKAVIHSSMCHTIEEYSVVKNKMLEIFDDKFNLEEKKFSELFSCGGLETLGDSILTTIVLTERINKNLLITNAEMTEAKSSLTNSNLALRGKVLSKWMITQTEITEKMIANMIESIIGALYLIGGMNLAKKFIANKLDIH